MTARISALKSLLPEFENILHTFSSSSARFRIVRTVNPSPSVALKTLYILDSSFNPPSVAHLALATSALTSAAYNEATSCRMLLLFSTHNADKTPSPAAFVQRIALMTMFAEDLSQSLAPSPHDSSQSELSNVSIDIGLTKEPYYTDKSSAITETDPNPYPSNPKHIHLVGYDTLIRFCNPKYYHSHSPPLSALAPFFNAGHKLHVTLRPFDEDDSSSAEFGTVADQQHYLQRLKDGELEKAGFDTAWAGHIDIAEPNKGLGVSSTRIRTAAQEENWTGVGQLCTTGVAAWIKDQGMYNGDTTGKKI
ncbi:Nucleotidylyl transferase, partial [Polyplosphaeria fusca]